MPTGYTSKVQSGEITDFKEYAMLCARAFGATITMRDDPLDAPIPKFKINEYYEESLKKRRKELEDFENLSEEMVRLKYKQSVDDQEKRYNERMEEIDQYQSRYENMLEKAKQYVPPTEEHKEFAKFMISQLEDSIEGDCGRQFWEKNNKKLSLEEWKQEQHDSLKWSLDYAEKGLKEEIERVNGRNKWMADLRTSLGIEDDTVFRKIVKLIV